MKHWSDYPILLAVAETGSLTAAGKKLGMSQPTVGRRIRALEDHYGTPLLKREEGGLVPTRFGVSMLDHITRMQEEADAIERSSATLDHSLAGVVRLSGTEGVGTMWLPKVLQVFREDHPDIQFDLGIGFRSFNLAQREADIALRWSSPGDQNSLIARKVASVTFGMFASASYVQRRGIPQTLEELREHDGVSLTIMDGQSLWKHDNYDKADYIPKRMAFQTDSVWAYDEAIANGFGIGMLPLCNSCACERDSFVRILPNVQHQEALYLVSHEDLRRSQRIRAVYDFLAEAFREDTDYFLNGGVSKFIGDIGHHTRLIAAE